METTFWYHLAKEFLKLPVATRFNIGLELKVLRYDDLCRATDDIDDLIFIKCYKQKKMNELIQLIQQAND